jgi:hypothetical protein
VESVSSLREAVGPEEAYFAPVLRTDHKKGQSVAHFLGVCSDDVPGFIGGSSITCEAPFPTVSVILKDAREMSSVGAAASHF